MIKLKHSRCAIKNRISSIFRSFSNVKEPVYITTPIYYANGDPHIGHLYTSLAADVMARFHRLNGKEVLFLTGTDDHGQKVEQTAIANGLSPLEFTNNMAEKFKNLAKEFNISYDDFIRTTEDRHKKAVIHIWKVLDERGFIYKGFYEGWYSVRDECFYNEDELIDGSKSPISGDTVMWVKEESYFFKLSSFSDLLLEYYAKNPEFIAPENRKNEVISFITSRKERLTDLSISRTAFRWGIPVPMRNDTVGDIDHTEHVVYVWLDALVNYISALGYPDINTEKFKKFWPATVQLVGKDIIRFHTIYWPAFLLAAGLPLPRKVFAHGWWLADGYKMSKSIGNVICPAQLKMACNGNIDYVRYYLISEMPFGNDGDYRQASLFKKVNFHLANDFGNLIQRSLSMIVKHCDGRLGGRRSDGVVGDVCNQGYDVSDKMEGLLPRDLELLNKSVVALGKAAKCIDSQELYQFAEIIIELARDCNRYFDAEAPWILAKNCKLQLASKSDELLVNDDYRRLVVVLHVTAEMIRRLSVLFQPIMPDSSEKIFQLFDWKESSMDMKSFKSVLPIEGCTDSLYIMNKNVTVKSVNVIFPKLNQ